jgi:hypothetical protein
MNILSVSINHLRLAHGKLPEAYQESLESKIGGNLLNKVGMAAIILGWLTF